MAQHRSKPSHAARISAIRTTAARSTPVRIAGWSVALVFAALCGLFVAMVIVASVMAMTGSAN